MIKSYTFAHNRSMEKVKEMLYSIFILIYISLQLASFKII